MSEISRKLSQEMVAVGPRKMAETLLESGCLSIIAAFNMTDDPARPWRFPKDAHVKAARLLQEITALFEASGFRDSRGAVVQADVAFQELMAKCTSPDRGYGRRR